MVEEGSSSRKRKGTPKTSGDALICTTKCKCKYKCKCKARDSVALAQRLERVRAAEYALVRVAARVEHAEAVPCSYSLNYCGFGSIASV